MIRRRRWFAFLVSSVVLLLGLAVPVRAASVGTTLELQTSEVIEVGVHPTVGVRLTTSTRPVAGAQVEIHLDGRQTKRLVTDANGRASTALARDLEAGSYELQAVFRGTAELLAAASPIVRMRVDPATFVVQTVPAIPDIALLHFDGGPALRTAADGSIRIPIKRVGRYELEYIDQPPDPGRRIGFDRWGDGSREVGRTIRLPDRAQLAVGLEIAYPVAFSFIDSAGAPVDPGRIQSLLIANDRGEVVEPVSRESEWLTSNRIVRGDRGLVSVPIEYRIQGLSVSGSNVVDRGRLHFTPDGVLSTWVVPLLLYGLTVSGQDAIFGYPIGTSVQLAYPDGTTASVPLDARGSATISALPRGNYRVVVERPEGFPLSTPVVLSRDQTVRVPVFSYVDVGILLGSGLGLAIALVLIGGRPVGQRGRRGIRRAARGVVMVMRIPLVLLRIPLVMLRIPLRAVRAMTRAIRQVLPHPMPALSAAGGAGAGSLMMPSGRQRWFEPVDVSDRHRHCPACTNRVLPRARVCRSCGRRLRKS